MHIYADVDLFAFFINANVKHTKNSAFEQESLKFYKVGCTLQTPLPFTLIMGLHPMH